MGRLPNSAKPTFFGNFFLTTRGTDAPRDEVLSSGVLTSRHLDQIFDVCMTRIVNFLLSFGTLRLIFNSGFFENIASPFCDCGDSLYECQWVWLLD